MGHGAQTNDDAGLGSTATQAAQATPRYVVGEGNTSHVVYDKGTGSHLTVLNHAGQPDNFLAARVCGALNACDGWKPEALGRFFNATAVACLTYLRTDLDKTLLTDAQGRFMADVLDAYQTFTGGVMPPESDPKLLDVRQTVVKAEPAAKGGRFIVPEPNPGESFTIYDTVRGRTKAFGICCRGHAQDMADGLNGAERSMQAAVREGLSALSNGKHSAGETRKAAEKLLRDIEAVPEGADQVRRTAGATKSFRDSYAFNGPTPPTHVSREALREVYSRLNDAAVLVGRAIDALG